LLHRHRYGIDAFDETFYGRGGDPVVRFEEAGRFGTSLRMSQVS